MNSKTRQQLDKALVYIASNLDRKLSAEQIANQANMSKYHFQRLFSKLMGETLNQYVLHRRLEGAAKLLVSEKSITITTVAANFGFDNHSYFSRVFKKHFNISPIDFRLGFDGTVLGQDASRPFLKTAASKYNQIDVAIEEYPTLWCNHKLIVKPNKQNKRSYDQSWLKVRHAFDEIQRSHSANLLAWALIVILRKLLIHSESRYLCHMAAYTRNNLRMHGVIIGSNLKQVYGLYVHITVTMSINIRHETK